MNTHTLGFLLLVGGQASAQTDTLPVPRRTAVWSVETAGLASTAQQTPFWLRVNQFGTVPLTAPTRSVRLSLAGGCGRTGVRLGYGLETVATTNRHESLVLPEAYVRLSLRHFEAEAGRRKQTLGLTDTLLTSGSLVWSGNALPVTGVQVGTTGFRPLGFTGGVLALHGFYRHGWLPDTDSMQRSYLHQKALYARLGRARARFKVYGGVLHNAQWGGRSDYLPYTSRNGRLPASLTDYLYVVLARQPDQTESPSHTQHDGVNRFGNHLGTLDMAAEWTGRRWEALAYYQHPYEDKSGVAGKNMPDGLYGIRLKNKRPGRRVWLRQVGVEYLTTLDQSGSHLPTGNRQYDGDDNYFNHLQYLNGWSVGRRVVGTPFITRWMDTRPDWHHVPGWKRLMMNNTRVRMFQVSGLLASASGWSLVAKGAFSQNFGSHRNPFPEKAAQFSGLLHLSGPVRWLGGADLGLKLAVDAGRLYPNVVGGQVSIRKSGWLGRSQVSRPFLDRQRGLRNRPQSSGSLVNVP